MSAALTSILKSLLNWGLQDSAVNQICDTTWQVGDNYVLKVYQSIDMLERNLKVLQILDEMKIPVGRIVPTRDNRQYVKIDDDFCFLSEKLLGESIVRIGNDISIARMMGEIIADLHVAFKKCEDGEGFWNSSLLDEMHGWVRDNFDKEGWKCISREAYEKTVANLADVYDDLPVQLIHRDVHFGNFLFENREFSGYVDFDLSQRNIRIFDICYFLLSVLSEKEKYEISEEMWFSFAENVFIGYEKKLKLSEMEKKAVPCVMECIELLFVSYFAGVHDVRCAEDARRIYEFIAENEGRLQRHLCFLEI